MSKDKLLIARASLAREQKALTTRKDSNLETIRARIKSGNLDFWLEFWKDEPTRAVHNWHHLPRPAQIEFFNRCKASLKVRTGEGHNIGFDFKFHDRNKFYYAELSRPDYKPHNFRLELIEKRRGPVTVEDVAERFNRVFPDKKSFYLDDELIYLKDWI